MGVFRALRWTATVGASTKPLAQTIARWKTAAALAESQDPSATLPRASVGAQTSRWAAKESLELGRVLGRGGMGVVRLAIQRSMGREVAVKTLLDGVRTPERVRKLLQEAWTTGRLEHPNIVPVYDVVPDEHGAPLVVLKRVEGTSWEQLLADPDRARAVLGGSDPLQRNLRVLMQLCRALHFAHSRGVLHLDIKPDNVMIGQHGEVYVVDWGIALALRDDGSGQLPLASAHRGIVGTPQYIAPEMLDGDGTRLDARTDVYLLGATLYELIAGVPPHRGETVFEVLSAAFEGPNPLPNDAPHELAEICVRAMARDPTKRFATPERLRRALEGFLEHRASEDAAAAALNHLDQLEADAREATSVEQKHRDSFAKARFGLERALSDWPENERARVGLERGFDTMIRLELACGDPRVAAALSQDAPAVSPALRARLEHALADRVASLELFRSLRRDRDVQIGQRTRVFVFGVLGVVWSALPWVEFMVVGSRARSGGHVLYGAVTLASMLVLAALVLWARDSVMRTLVNRVATAALFMGLVAQLAMTAGLAVLALPATMFAVFVPLLWSIVAAMVAASVERRAAPVAVAYLIGFFVAVARPSIGFGILALCNALFVAYVAVAWWPARIRGPIPESGR